jgi:hypothetical protein
MNTVLADPADRPDPADPTYATEPFLLFPMGGVLGGECVGDRAGDIKPGLPGSEEKDLLSDILSDILSRGDVLQEEAFDRAVPGRTISEAAGSFGGPDRETKGDLFLRPMLSRSAIFPQERACRVFWLNR